MLVNFRLHINLPRLVIGRIIDSYFHILTSLSNDANSGISHIKLLIVYVQIY